MIPGTTELAFEAVAQSARPIAQTLTIQATQVFGTLVLVEPAEFLAIHDLQDAPVVVHAVTSRWRRRYVYLTSYQGLAYCVKSRQPLDLRDDTLVIAARKVFVPI